MKIEKSYPPNYEQIIAAIPSAAGRSGVIFAYGDTIHVPNGAEISHHLKVHEAVHGIRQKEIGIEFWWQKYLTDMAFRYHEELLAHAAEYNSMIESAVNRKQRKSSLKIVAKRLASSLYGCGGGWKKAAKDIEGIVHK